MKIFSKKELIIAIGMLAIVMSGSLSANDQNMTVLNVKHSETGTEFMVALDQDNPASFNIPGMLGTYYIQFADESQTNLRLDRAGPSGHQTLMEVSAAAGTIDISEVGILVEIKAESRAAIELNYLEHQDRLESTISEAGVQPVIVSAMQSESEGTSENCCVTCKNVTVCSTVVIHDCGSCCAVC